MFIALISTASEAHGIAEKLKNAMQITMKRLARRSKRECYLGLFKMSAFCLR